MGIKKRVPVGTRFFMLTAQLLCGGVQYLFKFSS